MGYTKEEMTGHGFRSMASTLLHEQGWNHQVIERRKMMQAWADYLDGLKTSANVIPR